MNTPICDFVRGYAAADPLRLHMPGHKGEAVLGCEALDITEIPGADVPYHAAGIIRESEENAAHLFGSAKTLYSAEGSSLCIRAMLFLALQHARRSGRSATILAGRNAHKVFITASALLDLDVRWLPAEDLLSCSVTPQALDAALRVTGACAVYLTSPDYLGGCADLAALAGVCRAHGALLLVDNAHGAYLKFLPASRHPMDLGADLCCDSAHKTLPALTGAAYLHLSERCPAALLQSAEEAMQLFASTSPSYLILQSLDAVNALLAEHFPAALAAAAMQLDALKARLAGKGWALYGSEPMKLTLCPKARGYTGDALAERLAAQGIVSEFFDPDHIVFLFSPAQTEAACARLETALAALPQLPPILAAPPALPVPERVCSPREALFAAHETVPLAEALGRVLAVPTVSCPPAVPILVCGERIDESAVAAMRYYGLESCTVTSE